MKDPGTNLTGIIIGSLSRFGINIIVAMGVVFYAPALLITLGLLDKGVYVLDFQKS